MDSNVADLLFVLGLFFAFCSGLNTGIKMPT